MCKITINVYIIFIAFDKETLRLVGGFLVLSCRFSVVGSRLNVIFFVGENLLLEILSLEKTLYLHTTNNHLTIL